MKILIVLSCNSVTDISNYTFVYEQSESLKSIGISIDYYCIRGKGVLGYLGNLLPLIKKIKEFIPDIIHAHSGLAGLLANMQRQIRVVTTFHGSDLYSGKSRMYSILAARFSVFNVFVSNKMIGKLSKLKNIAVVPCGVDLNNFIPINRVAARTVLGYPADEKLILFAGSFSSKVKNFPLAKSAVNKIRGGKIVELKGFNREEVNLILCAVDVLLLTSFSEGSPQIVKEAMACNCPVVSVNVGDVNDIINNTEGCYICNYNIDEISDKLELILSNRKRTNGRKRIIELGLDNEMVAKQLREIYRSLLQ